MGAFLKIIIQRSAFLFFEKGDKQMGFFTTSVTGLKTVVTAIGAGVGVWGVSIFSKDMEMIIVRHVRK